MYHNPHMDEVRAINRASAYPSPIPTHDLSCALKLAENACAQLREAYRLSNQDNVLRMRSESAGMAARQLVDSVRARLEQKQ